MPGGVQGLDRYAYTRNNPMRYVDPTGHEERNPVDDSQPFGTGSVLVVNLADYVSINQYDPSIVAEFGSEACGLVAGSYAGASVSRIGNVAKNKNIGGYTNGGGIQPSRLASTYSVVYGQSNVSTISGDSARDVLNAMFEELEAGNIVIVDVLVAGAYDSNDEHKHAGYYIPGDEDYLLGSSDGRKNTGYDNTFAHFARVLGIDFDAGTITLDNTLGGAPWII